MAFKEGTEVEHVHAFRAIVMLAKALDEKIDGNLLTPHEALEEFRDALNSFPQQAHVAVKKGAK